MSTGASQAFILPFKREERRTSNRFELLESNLNFYHCTMSTCQRFVVRSGDMQIKLNVENVDQTFCKKFGVLGFSARLRFRTNTSTLPKIEGTSTLFTARSVSCHSAP